MEDALSKTPISELAGIIVFFAANLTCLVFVVSRMNTNFFKRFEPVDFKASLQGGIGDSEMINNGELAIQVDIQEFDAKIQPYVSWGDFWKNAFLSFSTYGLIIITLIYLRTTMLFEEKGFFSGVIFWTALVPAVLYTLSAFKKYRKAFKQVKEINYKFMPTK